MTAKRFTLEEFGLNFIVNDNGRNLTAKQTVDRLNELYEKDRDGEECYRKLLEKYDKLKEENEQLQARNDRQAKRLDRLYQLIGEKDWRALSDIMDDFKRCEEQLQREWRTYE